MKASDVIRIGRSLSLAPSTGGVTDGFPALLRVDGEFDDQDRVLGGEAHRGQKADLEVDVVVEPANRGREDRAPPIPSGMTSMTESGIDQLS